MLKAVGEELRKMAEDPKDPFHGLVRRRIGKRATAVLEKRLKRLILMMPAIIRRTHEHWKRGEGAPETRKLNGFLFAYLYNPHDFLSEDEHGLFGYLDDAYFVASVYRRVLVSEPGLSAVSGEEDALPPEELEDLLRYVRGVIPEEAGRIDEMIERAVTDGDYEGFAGAFRSVA